MPGLSSRSPHTVMIQGGENAALRFKAAYPVLLLSFDAREECH